VTRNLQRSLALVRAFRHEADDPSRFYGMLADNAVEDLGGYCRLTGATVVDVGGASGYAADAFRRAGARALTVDNDVRQTTEHGRRLTHGIIGDGCRLPLRSASVDVCHSSNVLEHVVTPAAMLSEMVRVVRPGGVVYVTFTNWLSPWGGHETSPWHYLGGERAARRYADRHGIEPKNRYGVSLFPLRVSDVLHWVRGCPAMEVLDAYPRYYPSWARGVVAVPGVREVLTWNLAVVMRRRPASAASRHRDQLQVDAGT
jgi:SAM-dependent methyltransferase